MRPEMRILVVVIAASLVAGCGGARKLYSLRATEQCMKRHGGDVTTPGTDVVAKRAQGGSMYVWFSNPGVNVSFGRTLHEADQLMAVYVGIDNSVGIAPEDRTTEYQRGNAVLSWEFDPDSDTEKTVLNCLK